MLCENVVIVCSQSIKPSPVAYTAVTSCHHWKKLWIGVATRHTSKTQVSEQKFWIFSEILYGHIVGRHNIKPSDTGTDLLLRRWSYLKSRPEQSKTAQVLARTSHPPSPLSFLVNQLFPYSTSEQNSRPLPGQTSIVTHTQHLLHAPFTNPLPRTLFSTFLSLVDLFLACPISVSSHRPRLRNPPLPSHTRFLEIH